jgi:hypothetical protein
MKIYIPTLGRTDNQQTWDNLPQFLRKRTYLICPPEEFDAHTKAGRQAIACPVNGVFPVGYVRQWILEQADGPFLMMDDDLVFCARMSNNDWHLRQATVDDFIHMYDLMDYLFQHYHHIGLSSRTGNNRIGDRVVYVARQHAVYGVNPFIMKKFNIRFDEMPLMQDFDVTLHLLRRGFPNAVIYHYCWNHGVSNAAGGCSDYRTPESHTQAAHMLKKRHPEFVTIVQKETKVSWVGMKTRTDVRVAWRKAYESAWNGVMS